MMIIRIIIALIILTNTAYAEKNLLNECVILLHGMGRTAASMGKMESELQNKGYTTWNKSYASTEKTIRELAQTHIKSGIEFCKYKNTTQVHFVTHSLGGILVRVYLQEGSIKNLGHIVMLSPPNKGSEVADMLKNFKLYQWTTGPAGQVLGTEQNSLPNSLKPIKASIGVITGNSTSDPWFSPFIPGEDDGKVSVEHAKLGEMADFLVVDAGHTLIMRNNTVINQTGHFLSHGTFKHQPIDTTITQPL
jgi:hypothetical protein